MDTVTLERFVEAQRQSFAGALRELQNGRKLTHWMWYIFPQLKGLGVSARSEYYGISGMEEAVAYMRHPILGPRLQECTGAILRHTDKSALQILGHTDARKLQSCMTLFREAAPDVAAFDEVLRCFYNGEPDHQTLRLLGTKVPE